MSHCCARVARASRALLTIIENVHIFVLLQQMRDQYGSGMSSVFSQMLFAMVLHNVWLVGWFVLQMGRFLSVPFIFHCRRCHVKIQWSSRIVKILFVSVVAFCAESSS